MTRPQEPLRHGTTVSAQQPGFTGSQLVAGFEGDALYRMVMECNQPVVAQACRLACEKHCARLCIDAHGIQVCVASDVHWDLVQLETLAQFALICWRAPVKWEMPKDNAWLVVCQGLIKSSVVDRLGVYTDQPVASDIP